MLLQPSGHESATARAADIPLGSLRTTTEIMLAFSVLRTIYAPTLDPKGACGAERQAPYATWPARAAIVDRDYHTASRARIAHPNPRPERQSTMRSREALAQDPKMGSER